MECFHRALSSILPRSGGGGIEDEDIEGRDGVRERTAHQLITPEYAWK
jgi:hypothetical protein